MDQHLIEADGVTVWVHDQTGTIARFGRYGIDIHEPTQTQVETGKVCRLCTHGRTSVADWERFKLSMKEFYDIEITDEVRPRHLARSSN